MFDPTTMQRLLETSERVFESYVEHLFTQNRIYSDRIHAQIPLIGGNTYNVEGSHFREQRLVIDALRCQHLFHLVAPGWAPRLPLHPKEITMMAHDPDPRHCVVALFAKFLHDGGWHISAAYGFPEFVRTLLTNPHTPDEIRNDQQLRKEYLPKPIAAGV